MSCSFDSFYYSMFSYLVKLNGWICNTNEYGVFAASPVTYSIMEGNDGDAFMIEKETGRIRVHVQLDYEKKTKVSLFDTNYIYYSHVYRLVVSSNYWLVKLFLFGQHFNPFLLSPIHYMTSSSVQLVLMHFSRVK